MATLLRIELLSVESEIEARMPGAEPRVYSIIGPQSMVLELDKPGDEIKLRLIRAAEGLKVVLASHDPALDMAPVPPSDRVGISVIMDDGREFYQGPAKAKPKRKR